MGTRGVTEVIYNGKLVVSQYGQWDHYPMGQGLTVLNFLRDELNIDKLKANLMLHLTYEASEEELKKIYANYFDSEGRGTAEDGEKFEKAYPSLTRNTGAGILSVIANAKTTPIPLQLEPESFKDDRLFCEGVYTINLDEETFTTRYNRYNNPTRDEDVLVMTFDACKTVTDDEYLTRAKCGVYQYHKNAELADA